MKNCVIRAFAHPSKVLLYLQVDGETGKVRFIARNARRRQVETINLSIVASAEILEELSTKGEWNIRYGHTLQTVLISEATKEFIEDCWKELKSRYPQFCIK